MEALPLATVKAKLSELVAGVERQQARVTITRNGRPVAVIVGVDDFEGLEDFRVEIDVARGDQERSVAA